MWYRGRDGVKKTNGKEENKEMKGRLLNQARQGRKSSGTIG